MLVMYNLLIGDIIMGTRSTIAVECTDGLVKQIYCHWDGNLLGNGSVLCKSYRTLDRALKLVALGDISTLHPSIRDTKFNSYHKSKNEVLHLNTYANTTSYLINLPREEYNYIMCNGEWFILNRNNTRTSVRTAIKEYKKLVSQDDDYE